MNEARYRPGGPIVLAPHDPGWAAAFQREEAAVGEALGDALVALHHIGSTAVPGIVAKPVIDILAVVTDLPALDARTDALERIGYEAMGELGIAGRRYFRKADATGARTHQIHAFAGDSTEIGRHLAFRDYLRAHPETARRYERLKRALAARFPGQIDAYSAAKTSFIREVEARAMRS